MPPATWKWIGRAFHRAEDGHGFFARRAIGAAASSMSYVRKLVTALSSGVFDLLDSVLERDPFDEFGELV